MVGLDDFNDCINILDFLTVKIDDSVGVAKFYLVHMRLSSLVKMR